MQEQEDEDQEALALELERALEEEAKGGLIDRKADAAQGAPDGGGVKRLTQGKFAAGEEDGPPCNGKGACLADCVYVIARAWMDRS